MDRELQLELECLEERQMLSSVQVTVAGAIGNESFDLLIDNQVVESYQLVGTESKVFTYETDDVDSVSANRVRVAFTNDFFDPINGIDRNLIVDKLTIDGVDFETESPATFSTGSYTETGVIPGNWQTEYLHTNGYFQYTAPSVIEVVAAGSTGDEEFLVEVNGDVLGIFAVSTEFETFAIQTDSIIDPKKDVVRVEFTNDLFVDGQIDRDLFIDKLIIDGLGYESESATTYSTGTWVGEGIPHEGFLSSETLHVTGYFEYEAATDITVRAFGDEGTEQLRLQIDSEPVATFELSTEFQEFTYRHITKLDPSQIRVEFFGDEYDPDNGFDKNANVDWIRIVADQYESEADEVYSNATFANEELQPGFGRGATLHTDGFFQYGFVPVADTFSIPEDSSAVPLAILNNDRIDGIVGFEIVEGPDHGSASIVDGELLYSPVPDFDGVDRLSYRLNSGRNIEVDVELNVRESHQQPQSQINPEVPAELTPSGKTLIVERLVQLPFAENGSPPRINMVATHGERMFAVADGAFGGDASIFELVTDTSGATIAEPFLDVGAAVVNAGFEIDRASPLNGLRSVAFHPDFDANGKFYVTYVGKRPSFEIDTFYISDPINPVGVESILAEFTYDTEANAVDIESYREVFRVGMPVNDHPIRQAIFNPFAQVGDDDYGLLYIGHGDGSEQSAVAGDGQNGDGLGKILRIDPLATETAPFSAPLTNPYINLIDYPDAVYAIGFRNPHNLTFALDTSGQVHLLVTDIGRDNIEEINVVVKGGNFGWADREGVFVHLNGPGQTNGVNSNIANLPTDDANNDYVYPVSIFGHDGDIGDPFVGQALAGGHVVQNGSIELNDQFIFVEFATDGRAYHIDFSEALEQTTSLDSNDPDRDSPSDLSWLDPQELTILFDHDNDDSTTPLVRDSLKDVLDDDPDFQTILTSGKVRADLRLGQGPHGELYVLNKHNGWIYVATNTQADSNAVQ